jgi:hypothetical protein
MLLGAAVLAACAAPSRHLSRRVVNDPIVLPRRMASVSIAASETWYPREHTSAGGLTPTFAVGLTDRLEYEGLLGLRYALLDDAPGGPRAPAALSLAIEAVVLGVGYSSEQGWIAYPTVGIRAQKHVADRWNLLLAADWSAAWFERPLAATPATDPLLGPVPGSNRSVVEVDLRATRQLGERFALSLGVSPFQEQNCLSPLCAWTNRGAGAALIAWFRPVDWLTLGLGPNAGIRYRPLVLPQPLDPEAPVRTPPRSVSWLGGYGVAVFYW